MKIYESQGNLIGHRYSGRMIAEDQNYIWIYNHAHTKDTLTPVFGVRSTIFTPDLPMDFDNMLGAPFNWDLNLTHRTANASHYYTGNTMYKTTCNGQLNLLGINPTGKWVSTYEPDYYYYIPFTDTSQTNARKHYKIELATGDATQTAQKSYGAQVHFLHETSTQLFGYYNFYHGSGRFGALNKGNLSDVNTLGQYSDAGNHNGGNILYKTDKHVTYFQTWHNSTNASAFVVCKNAWSDVQNWSTSGYNRTSADGSTDYYEWKRARLRKNIFKLNESGYDEDNGPDSYVSLDTTHNYNLLSDRTDFDARSGFYMDSTPGIVHDHDADSDGLVKTFEKLRWYVPYCSTDGSFQILRYNMSISDNDNSPNYDVRKCILSNSDPENLQQPSFDTINSHGPALNGSTNRAQQGVACAYFNDKKDDVYHHYLMMSFEDPTMRNYRQDRGSRNYNKIYVYKILNHNDSILDDIHEETSLDLELHQVIEENTMSSGLLRPNFDPKLFIYFNNSDNHPVYIWNNTQQLFDKTHSIIADAVQMGADSEGRIYTCNYHSHRNFSVDMFTLDIPSKVSIKMDDNKFEYTGTPIDSELKVNSFNWKGERLESKINLKVAGSGVVIIDSENSDAEVTTLEVTTTDSDDLTVPIKITSGSAVKINASIAPN